MSFFFSQSDSTDGVNARPKPWRCFFGILRNIFSRTKRRKEIIIYPRLELPGYDLHFEYDMSHRHRGVALIFNHENFTNIEKTTRRGTDRDRDRLKEILGKFAFDVQVFDDLSFKAMESELKRGLWMFLSVFINHLKSLIGQTR
jgi:Caspase domain